MSPSERIVAGHLRWRNHHTWFEQRGTNDTAIILLAGGPGASGEYFVPLAQRLAVGRRVVRYHPLGSGRSDRERPRLGWSIDLFLDELQALREHLELDAVDVLGHSWGGMLALEHILRGGDGVRGLVLYSALASVPLFAQEVGRLVAALPEPTRRAISVHEEQGTIGSAEYQEAILMFVRRHFCRLEEWPDILTTPGFGYDVYASLFGPSEFTITGSLADWDITPQLSRVRCPTLIVSGRYDEVTPAVQDELERGLPNVRRVTFEHSSHMAHLEEPDRFHDVLVDFLDGLG